MKIREAHMGDGEAYMRLREAYMGHGEAAPGFANSRSGLAKPHRGFANFHRKLGTPLGGFARPMDGRPEGVGREGRLRSPGYGSGSGPIMPSMSFSVHVVGGGLAGSECAWQLAERGVSVVLHEMRPVRGTPAHKTGDLA